MSATSGATVTEIIYCANKAKTGGGDPRESPAGCEQELADRIEAFRVANGAPTAILGAPSKNPQGEDVYVVILIK
jgi:hypothetical protein